MGVLARQAPTRQCQCEQIHDRILSLRHSGKGGGEFGEPMVCDRADELGYPAEVVVDHHRRQTGRGRHGSRLDRGRALFGQQADRGQNQPFRNTPGNRHRRRLSHIYT
jgi:hypothetical protein